MSTRNNKLALAIATALGLALPASAFATNGYFAHGYGTKNKGMGGAGVALSQDSLTSATNPAGLVFVGNRYDFGMEIFSPNRDYSFTGGGQGSDQDYFVIPHLGVNWMLGSNSAFGVAVYGNGGMNTEYRSNVYGGTERPVGVDLAQLFINLGYAQKIGQNVSLGGSVILVQQKFKAEGITAFGGSSVDATNLSNQGYDSSTGIGIRLGAQVKVPGNVTLGISYQPEIDMDEFNKYAGLFADGGDFDIPSTYVLGAAWGVTPDLTLVAEYQAINYEDVPAVSNGGTAGALGAPGGAGFGWEDISVIKLGAQLTTGSWTWRAGWNHGDNPIPNTEVQFNILAPGVVEDHLTFGFTKTMSATSEINFAYFHALKNDVTGTTGFGATTIEMYQNGFELSLGTKF